MARAHTWNYSILILTLALLARAFAFPSSETSALPSSFNGKEFPMQKTEK